MEVQTEFKLEILNRKRKRNMREREGGAGDQPRRGPGGQAEASPAHGQNGPAGAQPEPAQQAAHQ